MENNQNAGNSATPAQNQNVVQNSQEVQNQTSSIDYDKIQGMIDSRNSKTEESVLKSYFQSQGLSESEMKEAIQTFKTQKEEKNKQNIIDNTTLQEQLNSEKAKNIKTQIEKEALLQCFELGIDKKTIPYVIQLAKLENCMGEDGKINEETVKTALQKVLDDVPGFKKEDENLSNLKIGADGSNSQNNSSGNLFNFGFAGVRKH